jgi:uncharacterized membrane protein
LPVNSTNQKSSDRGVAGGPPLRHRVGFGEDFRRFFVRGLAALMPTLITLWLLVWVWEFLWERVGRSIIAGIRSVWATLAQHELIPYPYAQAGYIHRALNEEKFGTQILGVLLAVLLVYIVGVFAGNFLGRTLWRIAEHGVMKIPLIRAIYPAVKQVTDFLLSDKTNQFEGSKVVAVEPHEKGIWSIGLVTGGGLRPLMDATGREMITVFVPSSPTAFSGYVLVVPKDSVIDLPLKVEEAMRLLVSGGVLMPGTSPGQETPVTPNALPPSPPATPEELVAAPTAAVALPQNR